VNLSSLIPLPLRLRSTMFEFNFAKPKLFKVLYKLKGSSFVVSVLVAASSIYEANRKFDRLYSEQYIRVPDTTSQVK